MPHIARTGYHPSGAVLRALMDERGYMTVNRLAVLTGIRTQTLLDYSEGRRTYLAEHRDRIAEALDVPVTALDATATRRRA